MQNSPCVRAAADNPEIILDCALEVFAGSALPEQLLVVEFALREYWRDGEPSAALVAFYHLRREAGATRIEAGVAQRAAWDMDRIADCPARAIGSWLDGLDIPRFALDRAVPLLPVAIPKPWGQEIWYTGIERRGVAGAAVGGAQVPLPWLLALAPRRLCGGTPCELILLKILDPLPDAVYGDLYFELHREKQEVYVVTEVDRGAWPDGTGAIRFGFDPALRRSYGDDRLFMDGYLAAVRDYRQVRRAIDRLLDERRVREQVGLNDPVSTPVLRRWLEQLPEDLLGQEAQKRAAMDRFTGFLPLRVGDVVKVPCWVPHSLQHGVRTVEFQTPVYERLILSFAQKVLTQSEWDTEEAAALLQLDPPAPEPWEVTASGPGWVEERIVRFDDFEVRRTTLEGRARRDLEAPDGYALCMAIGGELNLDGAALAADQAVLVPGNWSGGAIVNRGAELRRFLWAFPRRPAA